MTQQIRDLRKNFNNFKYNRFNPSVNEWVNSMYFYGSGHLAPKANSNLIFNKLSYNLINAYFNIKFHMKKKAIYKKKLVNRLSNLSVSRIFVSIPEFKHSIQNLNILIYIFNKEELLLLRKIKTLQSLKNTWLLARPECLTSGYKLNNKSGPSPFWRGGLPALKYKSIFNKPLDIKTVKKANSYTFYSRENAIPVFGLANPTTKYSTGAAGAVIKNNLSLHAEMKYYKLFLYKNYLARLYFNKYMFNFNNLFYLKKALYNIYSYMYKAGIEININIINLKNLHLDNSIFVDAITRKLKDRKKKVLRVLRKALILPKIPVVDNLLLIHKKITANLFGDIRQKSSITSIDNTFNQLKNITNIRKAIYQTMKNTHITGIRLEGKGRLTRRLTASRAVFKIAYLGNLRNIVSSFQGHSTVINKGFQESNINYVNVSSNNRNGAFGIKSWQNTM